MHIYKYNSTGMHGIYISHQHACKRTTYIFKSIIDLFHSFNLGSARTPFTKHICMHEKKKKRKKKRREDSPKYLIIY